MADGAASGTITSPHRGAVPARRRLERRNLSLLQLVATDHDRRCHQRSAVDRIGWFVAQALVLWFLVPIAAALLVVRLRRSRWFRARMRSLSGLHPAPSAWDFAFRRDGPVFIRAKLQSGDFVGGFFGAESFAGDHPDPHDLFLERAWMLDRRGTFLRPIAGTLGLLIGRDEIERIEFLQVVMLDGKQAR